MGSDDAALRAVVEREGGGLELTAEGRLRCAYSGHEFPATAVAAEKHASSAKYRRLKAQHETMRQFAPHVVPDGKGKMRCKLTGVTLPMKEELIWAHIMGKKFCYQLEEWEAKKKGSAAKAPEPEVDMADEPSANALARREKKKAAQARKAVQREELEKAQRRAAEFREGRVKAVGHLDGAEGGEDEAEQAEEEDDDKESPCFWFPPVYEEGFMDDGKAYVQRGDSDFEEDEDSDDATDEDEEGAGGRAAEAQQSEEEEEEEEEDTSLVDARVRALEEERAAARERSKAERKALRKAMRKEARAKARSGGKGNKGKAAKGEVPAPVGVSKRAMHKEARKQEIAARPAGMSKKAAKREIQAREKAERQERRWQNMEARPAPKA